MTFEMIEKLYPKTAEFASNLFDACYGLVGVGKYESAEEAAADLKRLAEEEAWEEAKEIDAEDFRMVWNALLDEYLEINGKVLNAAGTEIDFDDAVQLMDDDIRERLHEELAPCTNQEFFTAYEKAHEEKYGEPWELSKANPVW